MAEDVSSSDEVCSEEEFSMDEATVLTKMKEKDVDCYYTVRPSWVNESDVGDEGYATDEELDVQTKVYPTNDGDFCVESQSRYVPRWWTDNYDCYHYPNFDPPPPYTIHQARLKLAKKEFMRFVRRCRLPKRAHKALPGCVHYPCHWHRKIRSKIVEHCEPSKARLVRYTDI